MGDRLINEWKLGYHLRWLAASLVPAILVGGLLGLILAAYFVKPSTDQLVELLDRAGNQVDRYARQMEEYVRQMEDAVAVSDRAVDIAERVEKLAQDQRIRIDELGQELDRLTTEDINRRLLKVNADLSALQAQLEVLRRIINPENAHEILNVARMAEEIKARENFTETVSVTLSSYEKSLKV